MFFTVSIIIYMFCPAYFSFSLFKGLLTAIDGINPIAPSAIAIKTPTNNLRFFIKILPLFFPFYKQENLKKQEQNYSHSIGYDERRSIGEEKR